MANIRSQEISNCVVQFGLVTLILSNNSKSIGLNYGPGDPETSV